MSTPEWEAKRGKPKPLDPDRPIWERQEGESNEAWKAFEKYRDMEHRTYREVSSSSGRWSREWSWQARVAEWDRHIARQEAEELVRYRVKMNERHRMIAATAQNKIVQWLQTLEPSKMRPAEAARWFEIAVKVERDAAGAKGEDLIQSPVEREVNDALSGVTLGELLSKDTNLAGLDGADEVDAAEAIYRQMSVNSNGSKPD